MDFKLRKVSFTVDQKVFSVCFTQTSKSTDLSEDIRVFLGFLSVMQGYLNELELEPGDEAVIPDPTCEGRFLCISCLGSEREVGPLAQLSTRLTA